MSDHSKRKIPTVSPRASSSASNAGFGVAHQNLQALPGPGLGVGQNQARGRWQFKPLMLALSVVTMLMVVFFIAMQNQAPQIMGNLLISWGGTTVDSKTEVAESRIGLAARGRTEKVKFGAGVESTQSTGKKQKSNLSSTTDVSPHPGFWEGDTPLARLPLPREVSSAFHQMRRLPKLLLMSGLGATKRVAGIVDRAVGVFVLRVKTLAECFDQSLVLLVQPPGTAELLLYVDAGNWAGARAWVARQTLRSPTFWMQDPVGNTLVHRLLRAKHHQHKHRDASIAEIDNLVISVLRKAGEGLADVQDWMGQTAMHLIARQNDFKLARVLLSQSPSLNLAVNKTNVFGATALQVAKSRNSQEMVDVLSPLCKVANATVLVGAGHHLLDVAFFCSSSLQYLCF